MISSDKLRVALRQIWRRPKHTHPSGLLQVINITRNVSIASYVEVAESGVKRSKGLLGRKSLRPGEGMWIVPCEAVHTFGMQFSLDLIYLDRQFRIKKIRRNVPPWRLSACLSAHSIIELAGGAVLESEACPGDVLTFSPAVLP